MSSTTNTELVDSGMSMGDSGLGAANLRLSLTGNQEPDLDDTREQPEVPKVKMPTSPKKNVLDSLQDSGICQDLGQLCLQNKGEEVNQPPTADEDMVAASRLREDSWQEYYEQDEDGDVQLHLAIASGYVEVVNALVRMAPHPYYLSIQNNASYAPLHIAILQNQPAIVRRLVVAGARLDVRDKDGNTPLHTAASRGYKVYHLNKKGNINDNSFLDSWSVVKHC